MHQVQASFNKDKAYFVSLYWKHIRGESVQSLILSSKISLAAVTEPMLSTNEGHDISHHQPLTLQHIL